MEACKNPTIKTESCYRRSGLFLYAENIVQFVIIHCCHFSVLVIFCRQIQVQVSSKAWMTLSYVGGGICEVKNPLSPWLPNQKECLLFGTRDAESDEFDAVVSSGMVT